MERWSYKPEVEGVNPSLGTNFIEARVPGIGLLNRTSEELGGKARGSTPPRASKKFQAGDVTDSIEVLQTSREGLTPSQSTKFLRRSSIGSRALVL